MIESTKTAIQTYVVTHESKSRAGLTLQISIKTDAKGKDDATYRLVSSLKNKHHYVDLCGFDGGVELYALSAVLERAIKDSAQTLINQV